jgi:hypothetical protein
MAFVCFKMPCIVPPLTNWQVIYGAWLPWNVGRGLIFVMVVESSNGGISAMVMGRPAPGCFPRAAAASISVSGCW